MADKVTLELNGVRMPLTRWIKQYNLNKHSVRYRYYSGEQDPYKILWGRDAEHMRTRLNTLKPGEPPPAPPPLPAPAVHDPGAQELYGMVTAWLKTYRTRASRPHTYVCYGDDYYVSTLGARIGDVHVGGSGGKGSVEDFGILYRHLIRERFSSPEEKKARLRDYLPFRVLDLSRWHHMTVVEAMLLLAPRPPFDLREPRWWLLPIPDAPNPDEFELDSYGGG